MRVEGQYYDGARTTPARVRVALSDDGGLTIDSASAGLVTYRIGQVRVHDRVGASAPRSIELPDGALLHLPVDPAFDALIDRLTHRRGAWVRHMELRWRYALAALVLVLAGAWCFVRFGMPVLASAAAERVSPAFAAEIGGLALAQFDEHLLEPSQLDAARQREIRASFDRLIASVTHTEPPLRLEFRSSQSVGPNALALPGGVIIITDQLVELSQNDDELLLVLAHETGHELNRDSLKQLFEGLGTTLVVAAMTGDPSSPASLAAAAPVVLIQSGYSRADERAADRYAFAFADAHGIARGRLTDLLARVEKVAGGGTLPTFLSTHPSTEDRRSTAE
ncbi:MAG TPA: M48 family metallopeptidase [Burkholderiaceae bacterium]|nr:M48 family metallopeptidase [Burkholderiaceae bacterium]